MRGSGSERIYPLGKLPTERIIDGHGVDQEARIIFHGIHTTDQLKAFLWVFFLVSCNVCNILIDAPFLIIGSLFQVYRVGLGKGSCWIQCSVLVVNVSHPDLGEVSTQHVSGEGHGNNFHQGLL